MPQTVTIQDKQLPVRPLHVLVPLIKADLEEAKTASERAGEPYYIAAGQKMLEAKGQMSRGEFGPWLTRHFKLSLRHAQRWMAYSIATGDTQKRRYGNISEFMREEGGDPGYGKVVRRKDWHEPVKDVLSKVDVELLNARKDALKQQEERDAERKLALQLIDIGFKALATKLHPDKGGSREAMARLNRVRQRLQQVA